MFTIFDELRDRALAVISYRVGTVLSSRVSYSRAIVELPFTKFRNAKQSAPRQTNQRAYPLSDGDLSHRPRTLIRNREKPVDIFNHDPAVFRIDQSHLRPLAQQAAHCEQRRSCHLPQFFAGKRDGCIRALSALLFRQPHQGSSQPRWRTQRGHLAKALPQYVQLVTHDPQRIPLQCRIPRA